MLFISDRSRLGNERESRSKFGDLDHTPSCAPPLRASIDGKPAAFLQSPGIAHPTKSKVEFDCMGKDGYFDDLKIWNAEPLK
jgi:hypothetical protein